MIVHSHPTKKVCCSFWGGVFFECVPRAAILLLTIVIFFPLMVRKCLTIPAGGKKHSTVASTVFNSDLIFLYHRLVWC